MGDNWKWYYSLDDDFFQGPFETKSEALSELDGSHGWIMEAYKVPLMLSDCIGIDDVFDTAEESAYDLSNEGENLFDVTPQQSADLKKRLKKACDDWQSDHSLVFVPWIFSHTRNRHEVNILEAQDDQ
jgi:hypothetical protein